MKMKTYKVIMTEGRRKSVLVTAKTEKDAIHIAKHLLFEKEYLKDEYVNILLDTYARIGYLKAEEIKKPEKKYPYYVTVYNNYPIYEPAEGGYYYTGTEIKSSHGFNDYRNAKKFIRKMYKDCIKWEDNLDKYWHCNDSHTRFGVNGKYVGDGWYIKLERKQGEDVRCWQPYC